jgi:hypothetical protein
MVLMLVVVTLLATSIGVSLVWVESGIRSVRRAEQAQVIDESMIGAVRLAAHERTLSHHTTCEGWPGAIYVLNDYEVLVECATSSEGLYLRAQVGALSLRAFVAEFVEPGGRWRLAGWEWSGTG